MADHKIKKSVLVSGLIITVLSVLFWYLNKPSPITVKSYRATRGEVTATVANTRVGTIKPCRRSYLAPAVGGQVADLYVKEGDAVKQKQLLMEVWNEDLQAQIKLQQMQIKVNQANAKKVCLLAAGAKREATRLAKLQQQNHYASEDRVDQAMTDANAQQAACQASRQTIIVNEAQLQYAQATLARTRVHAPFDGIVAEVNAELGEYVTPSPPGIPTLPPIDLLDVSCLYVSAPIDEVDAPKIKTGMQACISLDAFTEKRCSGTVTRIAPYVLEKEKQARTVEVEVKLTDAKDLAELLPGYSADIEILLASKPQVLRVPTEAVLENDRVLLIEDDGLLVERTFKPGLRNWRYIEILSGLQEGDRIVLSVAEEGIAPGIVVNADDD